MTEQNEPRKTVDVERTLQLTAEQVGNIVAEWAIASVPGYEDGGHVWTNAADVMQSRYFIVTSRRPEKLR